VRVKFRLPNEVESGEKLAGDYRGVHQQFERNGVSFCRGADIVHPAPFRRQG